MPFLPVAAREIREASRQARTYAWRWVTAAVALGFMFFIARLSRFSGAQGHDLFVAISSVAYVYCLFAGVVRTADTISEEKRDNTLGLLFLTDLKGWDIIFGKLLSSSVNCFFGLLAMLPMLAIPMLMGGVLWSEFARVVLTLITTLLLSISWGFLISTLFRQSAVTISVGLVVMVFVAGGIPLASMLLHEEFHLRELGTFVFLFSPTHCHIFSFGVTGRPFVAHYWTALLINQAIAWLNLWLATYFLPRFWQEVPKNKRDERWKNSLRAWRFGKGKAKTTLRRRLLNRNPLSWLANREQVSSGGLMMVALVVLLVSFFAGLAASRGAFRGIERIMLSWFAGLALVHAMLAFRIAMAASYRLSEDRRSGALELLLGTEISVKELVRGYWMALGRQFFGPIVMVFFAGVFGMAMVLLVIGEQVRSNSIVDTMVQVLSRLFTSADKDEALAFVTVGSIQVMLALNWIGLIWVGMWLGLREKRAGWATWVTLSCVFGPPWTVLIISLAAADDAGILRSIPSEVGIPVTIIIGWILGLSNLFLLSWWARRNLLRRFREAAADRYSGPRRIAWPRVRRFAFRLGAAGACVAFLLFCVKQFIDRRGEKAWAQALAAYPNFKLDTPVVFVANAVPDEQNLAKSPVVAPYLGPNRSRKSLAWTASASTRMRNEVLHWDWNSRRKTNLRRLEDLYVDAKVLTERASDPGASVLSALATYDAVLEDVHEEARTRPFVRYPALPSNQPVAPMAYNSFTSFSPNPSRAAREIAQTLSLRTAANLSRGSSKTEDLFLALKFADGLKYVPQSTVQFHEALLDTVQPIYDGLVDRAWSDADLKKIQDYFSMLDLWSNFDAARAEYVRQVIRQGERRGGNPATPRPSDPWIARQMPLGFTRQWQANTLVWGMTELPRIVDTKNRRVDAKGLREILKTRPQSATPRRYPDTIEMMIRSLAFTQTTADQIVLACALERFRGEHGKLPRELSELRPAYVAAIPHDVFTGEPLRYVVSADGEQYTLYSVGADGIDNKANPWTVNGSWMLWQETAGVDWVWNSAATAPKPSPRKK